LTGGPVQKRVWTILEMLQWGTSYLSDKGFDESRLTVELLLCHVLRLKRIQLYTSFDKPMTEVELSSFKGFFQRRLQHEPVQYIIGSTEFMGLEFVVDRRVLIPRPETEVLVEHALHYTKEHFPDKPLRILDIGTGSGCIGISLAALIENASVVAFDKSSDAIDVARINAEKNGVEKKIALSVQDVFRMSEADFSSKFNLMVSNPPYIAKTEFEELQPEIREFEPSFAVSDDGDGLSFYRRIAQIGWSCLDEGGAIIVEHAYNQSEFTQKIFTDAGWGNVQPFSDYSGKDRGLIATKFSVTP
jgi:release factor glutamine methyltransferase